MNKMSSNRNDAVMFPTYCSAVRQERKRLIALSPGWSGSVLDGFFTPALLSARARTSSQVRRFSQ